MSSGRDFSQLDRTSAEIFYNAALAQRVRKIIYLVGYGLNRGRRNAKDLRIGDALDFWIIAALVPNMRLLLLAQMKLPGKAWLEFDLQHETLV